jgi:hypothetical protein
MEEQERRVRTNSNEMGRPYFSINYKLSLSGRDLLSLAFAEMSQQDEQQDGSVSAADEIALQRRASDLSSMKQDLTMKEIVEEVTDNAPGTPKSAHQKKKINNNNNSNNASNKKNNNNNGNNNNGNNNYSTTTTTKDDNTQDELPTIADDKLLRKVKSSSGIREIELNRTAPAPTISSLTLKVADGAGEMLQGFVTCLNSRNVQKYRKGQKYRDGLIVGIDDEHGKIIVYNENLPRGALTIMKTKDSARYERGFQVEDLKGKPLGTVHAVDREANLIVLNSAANSTGSGPPPAPTTTTTSSSSIPPPILLGAPPAITVLGVSKSS